MTNNNVNVIIIIIIIIIITNEQNAMFNVTFCNELNDKIPVKAGGAKLKLIT